MSAIFEQQLQNYKNELDEWDKSHETKAPNFYVFPSQAIQLMDDKNDEIAALRSQLAAKDAELAEARRAAFLAGWNEYREAYDHWDDYDGDTSFSLEFRLATYLVHQRNPAPQDAPK